MNPRQLAHVAISLSLLVIAWFIVTDWALVPPYVLPSPQEVGAALISDRDFLWTHLKVTFFQWIVGVFCSLVLSAIAGVLCFYSKSVEDVLMPLLTLSQSVPTLALAPLLLVWFGLGLTPKIILVIIACFFPISSNFLAGLKRAKDEYQIVQSILQLDNLSSFRHIYFPGSLPHLFVGLEISASYAFVSAVMVELIGSEKGLGIYLIRAQSSYRTEAVILAVLIMITVSLLTTAVIRAGRRYLVHW